MVKDTHTIKAPNKPNKKIAHKKAGLCHDASPYHYHNIPSEIDTDGFTSSPHAYESNISHDSENAVYDSNSFHHAYPSDINPNEMVKYETGQERIRKGILDPLGTAATIEYNACRAEQYRDSNAYIKNCEFTYKAAIDKSIDFIKDRMQEAGSEKARVFGEALIERLNYVKEAPSYPVYECPRRTAFVQYARGEGLNDFCKEVLYNEKMDAMRGRSR